MENLQYLVEKVVKFYNKTLQVAKLGGPFTVKDLANMFQDAHFCADIEQLPPVYSPVVHQLQEKYNLLSAPQMLLVSLGDNLRVNQSAMETARKYFDRQVQWLISCKHIVL